MTTFQGNASYNIRESHQVIATSTFSNQRFKQPNNSDGMLREDHLFTDPELLKSIQMSYNDIKASKGTSDRPPSNYVTVGRETPVKNTRLPVQFTPESKQNTSFVIQTKPAQELYVENTNVAPPTQFYYLSPQMSPGGSRVVSSQRTFIVGSGQQIRPHSQSKPSTTTLHTTAIPTQTVFIPQPPPPIIVTPPSVIKQTTYSPEITNQKQIYRSSSVSKFTSANAFGANAAAPIDTVPRLQYEKSLNECRVWQQKYTELYQKFSALSRTRDASVDQEINQLRAENYQLEQRVVMYQRSQSGLNDTIERHVAELINKYKGSALKETEMLFDRFRLECRQIDRDREREQYYY